LRNTSLQVAHFNRFQATTNAATDQQTSGPSRVQQQLPASFSIQMNAATTLD